MKALKAFAAVLVASGLLAVAVPGTAGAAAYKHYVGCGHKIAHAKAWKQKHVCAKREVKGAFFKSLRADVVYSICVKFPSGKNLCAQAQEAERGTLYVNKITSTIPGRHVVSWFVKGKKVGSFAFRVKG
jgi:hypothetical protein